MNHPDYMNLNRLGSLHIRRSDVIDLVRSQEFLMGMTQEEMEVILEAMHMEINARENNNAK